MLFIKHLKCFMLFLPYILIILSTKLRQEISDSFQETNVKDLDCNFFYLFNFDLSQVNKKNYLFILFIKY